MTWLSAIFLTGSALLWLCVAVDQIAAAVLRRRLAERDAVFSILVAAVVTAVVCHVIWSYAP